MSNHAHPTDATNPSNPATPAECTPYGLLSPLPASKPNNVLSHLWNKSKTSKTPQTPDLVSAIVLLPTGARPTAEITEETTFNKILVQQLSDDLLDMQKKYDVTKKALKTAEGCREVLACEKGALERQIVQLEASIRAPRNELPAKSDGIQHPDPITPWSETDQDDVLISLYDIDTDSESGYDGSQWDPDADAVFKTAHVTEAAPKLEEQPSQARAEMDDQLSRVRSELNEQLSQVEELDEQLSQARASLDAKAGQIVSQDELFRKLLVQKENLEGDLEFERRTSKDWQNQVVSLDEIGFKKGCMVEYKCKLRAAEAQVTTLTEQLAAQQDSPRDSSNASTIEALRKQVKDGTDREAKLRNDVKTRDNLFAILQAQTQEAAFMSVQRESELSSLANAKKMSDERAKGLHYENEELAHQINALQKKYTEQSANHEDLEQKFTTSEQDRATEKEAAKCHAHAALVKHKQERAGLEARIHNKSCKVKDLEEKLATVEIIASNNEGDLIAQIERLHGDLSRMNSDLETERAKNASEWQEQSRVNATLQQANDGLKKYVDGLELEQDDLKCELHHTRATVVALTTKNTTLEQKLSMQDDALMQRDAQIAELLQRVEGLKEHNAQPAAGDEKEVEQGGPEFGDDQVRDIWMEEAESEDSASDEDEYLMTPQPWETGSYGSNRFCVLNRQEDEHVDRFEVVDPRERRLS
ncbi:hypothetical protein K458DRAFT_427687 [Lentithecium fluviatile CBS 122367]|uniref:Uncharacterized protein n=1 Tax=Lentithecium fluviatile CBS 122367 TaxID=1168545 RepID=A0A6G1JHD9_9PLEO|nr:hypothetical protein K458DRAFT_427687 [Lentithecium fluviatile CBS 122367]